MPFRFPRIPSRWVWSLVLIAVAIGAAVTYGSWWPRVNHWVESAVALQRPTAGDGEHDHHDDHGADDHAHDDASALDLSPQALRNLGLTPEYLRPVKPGTFRRSITVPAVIVERPGRTQLNVATPMTGVVKHVHAVKGEAVKSDQLLFEIRLTHEDLVQAQVDYLRTLGELDVELKEIQRLQKLADTGAIAGKLLLDRQYAQEKLEAHLNAEREALRLHGLSDRQVEQMAEDRKLLSELRIVAPYPDDRHDHEEFQLSGGDLEPVAHIENEDPEPQADESSPPLIIKELHVQKGQSVQAGASLCVLADYSELFIEGQAFEQDAAVITEAVNKGWPVTAVLSGGRQEQLVTDLDLQFIDNEVDAVTRTLRVYVNLPNEVVRDTTNDEGQRFVTWKYRPGQRLELRIPVEQWEGHFVLPVAAVAQEGAEAHVFVRQHGHFHQVPVYVIYRDQQSAVVSSKGRLETGDIIAMRSAHQMQMALKNKAGGGVDPHAGHSH